VFIHEMTEAECRQALQLAVVGRLACARDNQPYIVPVYFALDRSHVYAFTTLGQKIEWMRTNPKVCLEVDERIGHDRWQSVVVFGHYQELPDQPEYETLRLRALELLQKRAMWWEPAYVGAKHRGTPHSEMTVFYRIRIARITGHRATPDEADPVATTSEEPKEEDGWWSEIRRTYAPYHSQQQTNSSFLCDETERSLEHAAHHPFPR
jgi:nitroimidazol reductase NimA-like FMN-containing flavoprotein (pyridoxamine 5'-phosphate oxidase superfamily)